MHLGKKKKPAEDGNHKQAGKKGILCNTDGITYHIPDER